MFASWTKTNKEDLSFLYIKGNLTWFRCVIPYTERMNWLVMRSWLFFFVLFFYLGALAALPKSTWKGPTTGPLAQPGRIVHFIASDLKNGGTTATYQGFLAAARVLKWRTHIFDGKGSSKNLKRLLAGSIRNRPDAIILGGFDAADHPEEIRSAQKFQIKLVGWHAAPQPGPTRYLFTNVTTDPLAVAAKATRLIQESDAKSVGVIIFTDNQFSIARTKTNEMKRLIDNDPSSKVLEIIDIPISEAHTQVPTVIESLNKKYGKTWTHCLAINDIYFDHTNFPLINEKRKDIINISAGDGSLRALNRIRTGISQQVATIAEPLHAQGWQLADELNRSFAGVPPSGFVTDPLVVTKDTFAKGKSDQTELDLIFQNAYKKIWKK